ncbi:MAG: hypothetical protein K9G26_02050 [Emcibacter sp.]|nr:hypothetical protein [Emcibacter sp.]
MKEDKYNTLSDEDLFNAINDYELSSSNNGDYLNPFREEKSGSKWRKRPRRRRINKDDYYDGFNDD